MKRRRNKRVSGRVLLERRFAAQEREAELESKQAAARRKLLGKMDRKTAEYAAQEFAKLGLFQ